MPLVVRFGRLGDTVLLQPLLHRLHRRYGLPCTLLARGAWPAPLYAGHPDVARVIQLRAAHRPLMLSPERWRAVLALRQLRETPVYVCEPEPRALQQARRLLGLAGVAPDHCVFLADEDMSPDAHWVDHLLRFADCTPPAFRGVGPASGADAAPAAPFLHLDQADRVDCAAWLRGRGLDATPLVLLQPANKRTLRWNGVRPADDDDKSWPVPRWAELARAIRAAQPDSRVLLCGAPAEANYLHRIRVTAGDDAVIVVADELPLRRFMALAEIAEGMVSVDTGPAHVAAALGCPLVVLFGKVSPRQWKPRSRSGSAVIDLGGPEHGGRVDALGVEEVMAAWQHLPKRR